MTRVPVAVARTQIVAAQRDDLVESMAGQIRMAGWLTVGPPTREFRFMEERAFRFDFAYPALKVALEVEGGTWTQGDHVRGKRFESDAVKYAEAAARDWLVIRVTTDMVRDRSGRADGRALALLERAIRVRRVWSRIERSETCWWWLGATTPGGYGVIRLLDGTAGYVHREVLAASRGIPMIAGRDVDHVCHNADLTCPGGVSCRHRRCVRPDHLREATRSENLRAARRTTRRTATSDHK